jgi:Fe2+ or Zn2+ uptake regulation protein
MSGLVLQATETLRATGGRMTAQRRVILEALDTLDGHPTAEQVYQAVASRDETINLSTVYRTLGWLAENGLIRPRRLRTGESDRCQRFEPAPPAEHHHFVCTRCGQVIEFESPHIERVKGEISGQITATIERATLTLYGVCCDCRVLEKLGK